MDTDNLAEIAYFQVVNLWYKVMPEHRTRPSLLRKASPLTGRTQAAIEGAFDHLLEIVEHVHQNPQMFTRT